MPTERKIGIKIHIIKTGEREREREWASFVEL